LGGDTDGDGVCNADDNCPDVANADQADSDGDGVGNACDICQNDPDKTDPGVCGCEIPDTDCDEDGIPDCVDPFVPFCEDECPLDPDKTEAGQCGCGVADTDTDGDSVADCNDVCPGYDDSIDGDGDSVPDGCDLCQGSDTSGDTDSDGVCNDTDNCPLDMSNDADEDGVCPSDGDCDDNDGNKYPGNTEVCDGLDNDCNGETDEGDSDSDGIENCVDNCPDEDARGFDANNDGCIDNLSGLIGFLETLVNEGVIAAELKNSLISKVENAEKSANRENICAAINQLESLINQVNAQRGNKISDEAANEVIAYTESVIAYFRSQLPPGDSC
jgi:hypothetical protein